MTTESEFIAAVDQIDQFRAQSEGSLDIAIREYRAMLDGPDETLPFMSLVRAVHALVDPDDQLPDDRSDALTRFAETFACAVSRLIKVEAQ
nr:hypothetical protein [Mycobacterium sp. UM_NZ2]